MEIIEYDDYVVSQAEKDFYAEMYEAREVLKALNAGGELASRYQPDWSDQNIVADCKRNSYSRYFADYWQQSSEPDYLCFTAGVDNCIIMWNLMYDGEEEQHEYNWFPDLWWSTDKINWTKVTNTSKSQNGTITVLNNAGDKIYFKGTNNTMSNLATNDAFMFYLQNSCTASGDVTTLLNPEGNVLDLTGRMYTFPVLFASCTGLTSAPRFPSTTLAPYCYYSTFWNSGIVNAPELPATNLSNSCYSAMFNRCTSLTTAPSLPATTLDESCYNSMFSNCTALTTAPSLPATTLTEGCYIYMFEGCTNLNSVTVSATSWNSDCTTDWLRNVSATGTFTKPSTTEIPSGASGIPNGWTVNNV